MDNRKINLLKNTTILAIGNFSSKVLSFILVPLYTFYINPSDYGEVDIYTTILSMLYITVSLQSIESSFRFIQDCKTDREKTITFSNALTIALFGICIFSIIMLIIEIIINFKYTIIFIFYVSSSILANLCFHTLRGLNKMKLYAIMGVISTVINFTFNIIFIVGLGLGSVSLLLTPIITNIILIVTIIFLSNIRSYIDFNTVSLSVIKEHLKYSLPLIPNALGIWLMSSIGRFILLFYYGTTEVGLLAFALKFPLLLGTLNSIFFMAWQTSAISEYTSSDRDNFASDVFQQFSKLLLSAILIIMPLMKIVIFKVMGKSYVETWMYIPVFFIGVIFNSYAQFFSMGFFGAKKTNDIFYSVLISCIVYLVVGLILAKPLYIFGVGIAYSISELLYWIYIKIRVTEYMKININVKQQIFFLIMISVFALVYYIAALNIQIIMVFIGLIIIFLTNKKFIDRFLSKLRGLKN